MLSKRNQKISKKSLDVKFEKTYVFATEASAENPEARLRKQLLQFKKIKQFDVTVTSHLTAKEDKRVIKVNYSPNKSNNELDRFIADTINLERFIVDSVKSMSLQCDMEYQNQSYQDQPSTQLTADSILSDTINEKNAAIPKRMTLNEEKWRLRNPFRVGIN